jgi:hypothetical protein
LRERADAMNGRAWADPMSGLADLLGGPADRGDLDLLLRRSPWFRAGGLSILMPDRRRAPDCQETET